MTDLFKKVIWFIIEGTCTVLTYILKYIPGVQEVCNKEVCRDPFFLEFVPDYFKTQEMCNEVVVADPYTLYFVPDCYKTQEMCEKSVEKDPLSLKFVPDHYNTRRMREKAVAYKIITEYANKKR